MAVINYMKSINKTEANKVYNGINNFGKNYIVIQQLLPLETTFKPNYSVGDNNMFGLTE